MHGGAVGPSGLDDLRRDGIGSSRSSAGRSAKRGGRKAIRGACHSSQSTATPRIFSQWKSGAMKPVRAFPAPKQLAAAEARWPPRRPASLSIVPAHHPQLVGAADTLKGPRTTGLGVAFPTAHKPPTAVPPGHRLAAGLASNCRWPRGTVLARQPGSAPSLEAPYAGEAPYACGQRCSGIRRPEANRVHRIVTAIQIATAFLGVFWPDYILE